MQVQCNDFGSRAFVQDNSALLLDLYRLLTIYHSCASLSEILTEHGDCPFNEVVQFETSERARILISSAAFIRTIDDQNERRNTEEGTDCGGLNANISDSEEYVVLTLRQAANKIIHAENIENAKSSDRMFERILYLCGENRGRCWEARLNIDQYVGEYVRFLRYN